MISYRLLEKEDVEKIVKLWNQEVSKQGFYKPFTKESFINHVFLHPEFRKEATLVALDQEKIVGFILGTIRHIEEQDPTKPGYLVAILVDSNYRNQGIGTTLIHELQMYFKKMGKTKMHIGYTSTLNFPWYIPNTPLHDHPGAPGVILNSDLYLYFINHGFEVVDHQDAFHLDLTRYEMPKIVNQKMLKNEADGYTIELYDANQHEGLEIFFKEIQAEPFERVIRENLKREHPYPFFVVSNLGKIVGWTGAMWTETSGRAHFDGIIIAPKVRGRGIGQSLFCKLGLYSKEHGSSFMTFFTGRHNPARYIYLGAGFKIIQSFAIMEKGI